MRQLRAWGALSAAFVLGILATAAIPGCQEDDATVATSNADSDVTDGDPTDGDPTDSDPTGGDPTGGDPTDADPADRDPVGDDSADTDSDETETGDPTADDRETGDPDRAGDSAEADPDDTGTSEAAPESDVIELEAPETLNDADASSDEGTASDEDIGDPGAVDADANDAVAAGGQETGDVAETGVAQPGDWPQWGGTSHRNNVPVITGSIPTYWAIGSFDPETGEWDPTNAENIKWVARTGSQTYGNPVVAGGKLFVGTNNAAGYLSRYPGDLWDLGCLIAFRESDGEFLWQHSSEKLPTGRVHDWPYQGICCAPYIEGERLWFVSSRGTVVCVDTEGFYDGEDDGPVTGGWARLFNLPVADNQEAVQSLDDGQVPAVMRDELSRVGMGIPGDVQVETGESGSRWTFAAMVEGSEREFRVMVQGPNLATFKQLTVDDVEEADVIWEFDMMEELKVSQHNMASCSITGYGDLIFVCTSNGVDVDHRYIPEPEAPSFMAMDKNTGEVLWTDNSPAGNILHGQWSSPAMGVIDGVPQVVFAGGDGWIYSFRADRGSNGEPELLWKFDANPKASIWVPDGTGSRNNIIATPVIHDGLVYCAVGQDPEHGEGMGHLWCIDPTGRGDLSAELAVRVDDRSTPIPHKRIQAVEEEEGEVAIDNPNSGVVWHYDGFDQNGDGRLSFEETMHRSCGTVAIKDNILFISDFSGLLHCLDAKSGSVHWTYDMFASAWGSPLIAGDKVYVGDADGDVAIFNVSTEPHEPIFEILMINAVYSTPIVANGTLYIANRRMIFAIEEGSNATPSE